MFLYLGDLMQVSPKMNQSFSSFLLPVDSNETLYGGDPKFLSEINKLCETLIGQILDHLKTLSREEVRRIQCLPSKKTSGLFCLLPLHFYIRSSSLQQSARRQGTLAFALFGILLAHGDLRNNKLSQLAVSLWNLSHKQGSFETRISVS